MPGVLPMLRRRRLAPVPCLARSKATNFMTISNKDSHRDQCAVHSQMDGFHAVLQNQNKFTWSENRLMTDSPLAMGWIVPAISGPTASWRTLVHSRAASDSGIVLVTTTSSRAEPAMRSMAGPEKIGCVQ